MFMLTTPNQHLLHRLKICSGHIEAIQKHVENGKECLSVVLQIQAVKSALKKIELILIQDYLLKHSTSSEQLTAAVKSVSSSSLHLSASKIRLYQEKRRTV